MKRAVAVLAALAAGWAVMHYVGDRGDEAAEGQEKKPRTAFAEDRDPRPKVPAVPFDGARAMGYLKAVCDLGPRMSGTPSMKKQQGLLRKHFAGLDLTVTEQPFTARQSSQRQEVEMTNLIVSIHPDRKRRVLLCSHYDTRPIADQERDPRKWREPFVSANDGGSGVAFLMEFANHTKDLKTDVGIDLVFFDGEEYVFEKDRDRYFFGSQHFAKECKKARNVEHVAAVLLDMIAGKEVRFPVEGHSWFGATQLCRDLWGIAQEQGCKAFAHEVGQHVLDDHIALLKVGIPAVDLIDFDYPHWHKLSDTPENCTADGLEQVARVLNVWLQRVK
jgi:glutaminyl-peptide cyclotransferase